jgi:hypothetical protein
MAKKVKKKKAKKKPTKYEEKVHIPVTFDELMEATIEYDPKSIEAAKANKSQA